MSRSQMYLILLRALLNTAKRTVVPHYLSHRPQGDPWPLARDEPGSDPRGLIAIYRENRWLHFQVAQCVLPDRMEALLSLPILNDIRLR